MIHYSCDRCKKIIDQHDSLRYAVKIEVQAAMEPLDLDDVDADRDHLLEIQEMLERMEDEECSGAGNEVYQKMHYDLCSDCHRQYVNNPLGSELPVQIGFSQN